MNKIFVFIAIVASAAIASGATRYLSRDLLQSHSQSTDPRYVDDTAVLMSQDERGRLIEALSERVYDPASIQIRKIVRSSVNGILCGEINAKNRMGGYAGYVPFNANMLPETPSIITGDHESDPEMFLNISRGLGCKV